MSMLLVLIALVAFTYFGDKRVPKILKDNKQIILGVLVGVLLQHVLKDRVEGFCALKLSAKRILEKRGAGKDDPICGTDKAHDQYKDPGFCTLEMEKRCNNYSGETEDAENNCKSFMADPTGLNTDMQQVCNYTPGSERPTAPPCPPDPDKPKSGVSAWSEDENDCTCSVQKEEYTNKITGVKSWRCDISGGDQ